MNPTKSTNGGRRLGRSGVLMALLVSTFTASSVMLSTPAGAAAVDQCAIFPRPRSPSC